MYLLQLFGRFYLDSKMTEARRVSRAGNGEVHPWVIEDPFGIIFALDPWGATQTVGCKI